MAKLKCIRVLMSLFLVFSVPVPAFAQESDEYASRFLYADYSKRISMDFKNASLNDVLKILSQQSGLNFIASQEIIDRQITLFLEDVPVEEALDKILRANNLTYEIDEASGIFIVRPVADGRLVTRIYTLKHATVSSSKLNATIEIEADSDEEGGGEAGGGGAGRGGDQEQSVGLIAALQAVMSPSGKIVEEPRTNSLIVSDLETQFPHIEATIARLDVQIPQILIEVEMLDVSKGTTDLIGVKIGDTPLQFNAGTRQHLYPWNQNRILDKGFAFEDEYTAGTIDATGLTAILQFLKTQTDTKNLARPRILTLNNQTAQIRISTDEAIGISTQSSTSDDSETVEVERANTGVFLTVTPQVNPETGDITMAIAPKVIEAREGATFSGTTFRDPEERGSRSILRMKSGDTVILGGLMRKEESKVVTKVPLLGDIPLLGKAFRHTQNIVDDRELLIFITPHILSEGDEVVMDDSEIGGDKMEAWVREQDFPVDERFNEVDRELAVIESQR